MKAARKPAKPAKVKPMKQATLPLPGVAKKTAKKGRLVPGKAPPGGILLRIEGEPAAICALLKQHATRLLGFEVPYTAMVCLLLRSLGATLAGPDGDAAFRRFLAGAAPEPLPGLRLAVFWREDAAAGKVAMGYCAACDAQGLDPVGDAAFLGEGFECVRCNGPMVMDVPVVRGHAKRWAGAQKETSERVTRPDVSELAAPAAAPS